MTNAEINDKLLKIFYLIKNKKLRARRHWYLNKDRLGFLYSELNLNTRKNIYLFDLKIIDIQCDSDILSDNSFKLIYKIPSTNKNTGFHIICSKNICYFNDNMIIVNEYNYYNVFIFSNKKLITKLKMLITI